METVTIHDGWILGLAAMAAPGQLSVWALPAVNCWRSPCEDLQHTYCGMEVNGRLMHPYLSTRYYKIYAFIFGVLLSLCGTHLLFSSKIKFSPGMEDLET